MLFPLATPRSRSRFKVFPRSLLSLWLSAKLATGYGNALGASRPGAPSIPLSSLSTRRASRAILSLMPVPSSWPICYLLGIVRGEAIAEILHFTRFLANDETIAIDPAVARSETETGFRNLALANYMRGYDNLKHPVEMACGVYFHQCAIAMSCCQLARAGLFLADYGRNPSTGLRVVSNERARRINALMLTCGHYDGSGDFAYRVGLPGKSGVGGGILAIVPGVAALAVWSPR